LGALPPPRDNGFFKVEWQDLNTMTEGEKYSVAQTRLGIMQTYATTDQLKDLLAPQDMMQLFVGMSEDEATGLLSNAKKHREGRGESEVKSDIDEEEL
jgi:hypothetical protein